MLRKAFTVLMIALGLVLLAEADRAVPARLAGDFERYSRAIQASDVPVSAVERFLFSVLLANSRTRQSSDTL